MWLAFKKKKLCNSASQYLFLILVQCGLSIEYNNASSAVVV